MQIKYDNELILMNQWFENLFQKIVKPLLLISGTSYDYRFKEKSFKQAIIQKLARSVTGLRAINILNDAGLYQEQAALQRILDEVNQDILYLSMALIYDDITENHHKYLEYFYQEEYDDSPKPNTTAQGRGMVSRKKIRAFISKNRGTGINQSSAIDDSKILHKIYSGYVHAASPQIMELYFGNPPKFQILNSKLSPFRQDHIDDILNYYYRTIHSFAFAAKAFENDQLYAEIIEHSKKFAKNSGREADFRNIT